MRNYTVTHIQAVWETSVWEIEANSEDEAMDRIWTGRLIYKDIGSEVEGIDSELTTGDPLEWKASQ